MYQEVKQEDPSQVKFAGPIPPPAKLPPKWKCAKDKYGRPYYYHVKIRKSQWEPPPLPEPVEECKSTFWFAKSVKKDKNICEKSSFYSLWVFQFWIQQRKFIGFKLRVWHWWWDRRCETTAGSKETNGDHVQSRLKDRYSRSYQERSGRFCYTKPWYERCFGNYCIFNFLILFLKSFITPQGESDNEDELNVSAKESDKFEPLSSIDIRLKEQFNLDSNDPPKKKRRIGLCQEIIISVSINITCYNLIVISCDFSASNRRRPETIQRRPKAVQSD